MKSKFLAGLIATLVTLIALVAMAVFLTLVLEVEPRKNALTYTAAFLTIAIWAGLYRLLKPKESLSEQNDVIDQGKPKLVVGEDEFLAMYRKSPNKALLGGIIISGFFIPIGLALLMTSNLMVDHFEIVGGVIFLLLGLLGIVVIVKTIIQKSMIKSGQDPLIKAIQANDSTYVKWYFGSVMSFHGSPVKTVNNYHVFIYTNDHIKGLMIQLKNEQAYEKVMAFLSDKFPSAETENTPEIREEMRLNYGFKSRK